MASSRPKKRHEELDSVEWDNFVWGKSYARTKMQQKVGTRGNEGWSQTLPRGLPGGQTHGQMLLPKEAGTSPIL